MTDPAAPRCEPPEGKKNRADYFELAPRGWTCFHCGETFTTPGSARDHFGADSTATPACQIKAGEERGLLMTLRKSEAELQRYRAEDSDADRQFHAMRADHARALIQEEQKGYDKGLSDGRALVSDEITALVRAGRMANYWVHPGAPDKDTIDAALLPFAGIE